VPEIKKIALLIDCDNVSHNSIEGVLEELAKYGMVPSELRDIVRRHQKTPEGRPRIPVLFRAAADALQALVSDERYVGGQFGMTAVLHTWSGAMIYHPHLHCLVPGAGITENGEVHLSRKKFLVPVQALSAKFRGRFLALARKAVPDEDFSKAGKHKKWVVFSKAVKTDNVPKVLKYLGRYLHRIAISNGNIIKIDSNEITFRYKKTTGKDGTALWGIMALRPMEFLRRFLRRGGLPLFCQREWQRSVITGVRPSDLWLQAIKSDSSKFRGFSHFPNSRKERPSKMNRNRKEILLLKNLVHTVEPINGGFCWVLILNPKSLRKQWKRPQTIR